MHSDKESEKSETTENSQNSNFEGCSSLNVLTVGEADLMEDTRKRLKELGINYVDMDVVDAFDALTDQEDKIEAGEIGERDRWHWLFTSNPDLAEVVRHELIPRPYITAIVGPDDDPNIKASLRSHADQLIEKTEDSEWQIPKDLPAKVSEFAGEQIRPTETHPPEETHDDQQSVIIPDHPEIISGEDALCIYELMQLGQLPDLRKPDSYPKDTKVVLLDVDGTVTEEFVMGRIAEDFKLNPKWAQRFQKLLDDNLSPVQRKLNKAALNRLYIVKGKAKKSEYIKNDQGGPGDYNETIQYMNSLYGRMMARLPVRKVCALIHEWAEIDVSKKLYKFTMSLVEELQDIKHVVLSLITGMPAEAIAAYKKTMDIEEMGHCLVLEIEKDEKGDLVYTGSVAEQGGTESSKKGVAGQIKENYEIVLVLGNQPSDLEMMKVGIGWTREASAKDIAYGKALYVTNMFASDFTPKHMDYIKAKCKEEYKRGHLQFIHYNPDDPEEDRDTRFWVCQHSAVMLMLTERFYQYQKDKEELSRNYRDDLHAMFHHPVGKTDGKGNIIEGSKGFKKYAPKKKIK